ncbi:MAG TPA: thiol reductant ABC exporter subunit CydD [Amycolatopsis sp.]|uniref:thiol reductant ABC exporter subunit CydD n=1 Tax=Amycolatopsis sp. TaxID=37632 RepID=UPI002B467805|nr:thiol reductant ABC exporter subunit CydD [Amycolatopsis sp.]HKS48108.1 thiol reductant ABC exporter subunit CydD [Amycolatopsis sp.]
MSLPGRTILPAFVSKTDTLRPGKGPLGALPALSMAARRALGLAGVLALLNAVALVAQAFLLASACAEIGHGLPATKLAALLGVVPARAAVAWAMRLVAARAAAGAKEELRARAVDHALRLGPEWIAARGPGELTALTTKGLDALDAYFTEYLPALVTAAVVPLAAGAAVLFADWPSAAIIALTVPLLPVFAILVGKYTADRSAAAADTMHRLSGHLLELVRALPVLAAFRRAEAQAEAVGRVSDRHRRATLKTLRVAFSSAFVLELATMLSVALIAVVIGVRLVSGDLSLTIGLAVLILAPECYQPLRSVGAAFHASEDGVEAVRRVTEILAEPAPLNGSVGSVVAGRAEVRVDGLRVSRRNGFAPDGESFSVKPGEIVWLRSPSGAGKSTTLSVLLGFVMPREGTVTVDGVPMSELDLAAWRRNVAWVPQSPAFTGGTVRAELELALADQDEDPLPGEIEDVLAAMNLTGFESARTDRLSLGQRQRVAVARALLRVRHGAWLLLLDEPTAHLDATNAASVMAAVEATRDSGAAVVIAAHARDDPRVSNARPAAAVGTRPETSQFVGNSLGKLTDHRLVLGAVLGALALVSGLALTAVSGWLIAKAAQQPPILTLTVAVVGVRAFGLARAGLRYIERLTTHDAAFRIAGRLRVDLWRALVRIGPARALGLRDGEGQRRLVADVDTVRDLLPRVVTPPLVAGAVLVSAVVVQTVLLPSAGLVLFGAVLSGALGGPLLALRLERRATSALASGRRDVSAKVLALFSVAAELLAFGAYRSRRAELASADARLAAQARRQAVGAGAADALITLTTGLAAVTSVWLAALDGRLDPVLAPVLALVPLALAEVLALLPPVAQHWNTLRRSRVRLANLGEAPALRFERDNEAHVTGNIRWPGGEPVLHGVDVRIPAGKWVAVTGASGSGKSTLLAALLGFLDVRGSLPTEIAWAPQDPQLVSTTVAENLRLADPHATDDQLIEALHLACLPDLGLDTVLGSAGSGLSGGQAQRLALARALVAAPKAQLVLLDEPTAHLEEPTAAKIRANLRTVLAGRTVVFVTHHLAESEEADLVLEVCDGRVRTRKGVYP